MARLQSTGSGGRAAARCPTSIDPVTVPQTPAPNKDKTPAFTVAISTYNRPELLLSALASVFAQTYEDYEVIVVDNGSCPATREALGAYMDRITYVWQENRGRAGGRNRALELARGTYIAFLDDDDEWLPDKLERQAAAFAAHPEAGLVHGHVDVVAADGRPLLDLTRLHRRLWSRNHRRPVTYASYALECRCFTSATAVHRAGFDAVGPYDPAMPLEDVDLYLRLARRFEVVFLEGAPLARYRYHDSQTSDDELTCGQIAVAEKHLAALRSESGTEARLARRNFLLSLAWSHHVLGDRPAARRCTLRAILLDPMLPLRRPSILRPLVVSFLPSQLARAVRRSNGAG
jgi:glycosyltransferase involved in cell wall biosynthesis